MPVVQSGGSNSDPKKYSDNIHQNIRKSAKTHEKNEMSEDSFGGAGPTFCDLLLQNTKPLGK